MPRNTREWALRKISMAEGNIGTLQVHLSEVIDRYLPTHAEIAEPLFEIIKVSDILVKGLERIRESM